jgi:hypothetical protein
VWIARSRFIGSLAPVVDALEVALQDMLAASEYSKIA